MLLRKASILALLTLASASAHAAVEPILTAGYEFGGNELVQTTTTDLNAGGGISFGAGLSFTPNRSTMSLRVVLHYLFNSVEFNSPDGDAEADSFPLELGLFKTWDRHEFGVGPSIHINPTYQISSSSPLLNGEVDFDNATGVFLAYHYIFSRAETASYTTDTYIAVKLRAMDYETGNTQIDADSLGLYIGSKF